MPEYTESQRSFGRAEGETQGQADFRAATAATLRRYGNRINLRGAMRNAYIEPPVSTPGEQGARAIGFVRDSSYFADQPRLYPGLRALKLDKRSLRKRNQLTKHQYPNHGRRSLQQHGRGIFVLNKVSLVLV